MVRRSPATLAVALLVVAVLLTAAGYAAGSGRRAAHDGAAGPPSGPLGSVPPGSLPGTTRPADASVQRILVAGDSVLAPVALALREALSGDPAVTVRFVLTPTILRDRKVRAAWQAEVDAFAPDVVVVNLGTWEAGLVTRSGGYSPEDPRWPAQYAEQQVEPWVGALTDGGVRLVWVGNARVTDPTVDELLGRIDGVVATVVAAHPDAQLLDAEGALNGTRAADPTGGGGGDPAGSSTEPGDAPTGGVVADVVRTDAGVVRTRQVDGLHLCPAGAARLADQLVPLLVRAGGSPAWVGDRPAGWPGGAWQDDPEFPPDACPAP